MVTVSKLGSVAHVSNEALKQVIRVREESKSRSETLGREERHGWEPLTVREKIGNRKRIPEAELIGTVLVVSGHVP